MPACLVMSLNVTCAAHVETNAAHNRKRDDDFRMTFMACLVASCDHSTFLGDAGRSFRRSHCRAERCGNMLVNQLAFVVVLGMETPIRPGNHLRRLIGLKA